MFKPLLTALTMALLLMSPSLNAAENEITKIQKQIDAFKQSELSPYAPQTISRANAYLGAAILANEQEKTADANIAMTQAKEKLAEANQTATGFMTRFASLINLRKDALKVVQVVNSAGLSSGYTAPKRTSAPAQTEFDQTISSHEQGQLNQTQAHANKAQARFQQLINEAIPQLTELTASAVGKAANGGAKQYAPQLYQAAKDKMAELRNYNDGLSRIMPSYPEQGIYLARESKHISNQVKLWRKKTGSHEKIVLDQRALKLQLANALKISNESTPMLTDIAGKDLLAAIQDIYKAQADEREAHRQEIAQLKQQSDKDLKHQLESQTNTMMQAQQNRMSTIKEAFRAKLEQGKAKLERETFETKRQTKLRKLFKKGEVKTFVNLDGSLLIRLSGLKFAPAKSKIGPEYADMLGRLNEAMSIYHDRSFSIEGHTDNLGDVKPNQQLSLKRAESVRDFLVASGADSTRLKALGYGEVRPIASNDFPQGRTMNRRIDVVINAGVAAK